MIIVKYLKLALLLFVVVFISVSCEDDTSDNPLYFIGDSLIANWDTEFSFPNRVTHNFGKNGEGVNYISSFNSFEREAILVIEIGTNDIKANWNEQQLLDYFALYEKVICNLSGMKVLIIEVLPTSDMQRNKVICDFNRLLNASDAFKTNRFKVVPAYRLLEENGTLKDDLMRDGLHLNDYGYRILTSVVYKCL